MPEESRDTRRGIQNVQGRVSRIPSRETVGERHLRGGKWSPEAANDAGAIQAANDDAYAAENAMMIAEAQESANQSRIQQAIKEKGKKMLLKKLASEKTLLARTSIRSTLWYALIAYVLQIFFAVGAMLGFGGHAVVLYLRHETIVGRVFGVLIDFQNILPFEGLGYVFWGLGIVLSLALLIGYNLFFFFIGISVLRSSTMFLIMVVCFAFNIIPFINILPWLLLWVIYMSLFSSRE
ncbi:hypothetical protein IPH92_04125 [Candidatus Kaiserbacteria bacterium]|nr:MAG: hypothetical protein IPH92_04125 [Candidatus Kaiserbacteria bacterium]